jgi:hypothetical protein
MPDRLADLIASTAYNGIDFVEIASTSQTRLVVHFLNAVTVQGTLTGTAPVQVTGGESVSAVPVLPIAAADWGADDQGRPLLTLTTAFCGDFSSYQLSIASPVLDPYFASVRFTFKAGCPSTLDCAPPARTCDLPSGAPAIDYLAKDFASFRAALLDYSATAYPYWVERDEADLGLMLAELLSAVGDDLSYQQDRIAAEATLATATQRRSVIRHARLVDYEPAPATSARVLLQVDVSTATVPSGVVVLAPQPDSTTLAFELGDGLLDPGTGQLSTAPLLVDPRWNRRDPTASPPADRIVPYLWDDAQGCLTAGSTQLWVRGHGFAFPIGDPQAGTSGLAVLIDTDAATPVDPPIREVVHLTGAFEETDTLYGVPVTRLTWDADEALTQDHDLGRTRLAGNLVGASEGRRYTETFVIDPDPAAPDAALAAVARTGPDAGCAGTAPIHLHTLRQGRLAWLRAADGDATPEVYVLALPPDTGDPPRPWRWRRRLLDADLFEEAYTIDPVRYRDLRASGGGAPWFEYDGHDGDSIRFGDGTFGERPAAGTRFEVTYRVTSATAGNVAAGSVTTVGPAMSAVLLAVTNPFAAAGGAGEEPLDRVRRDAPQAFRSRQFRAVRAQDYDATAQELDWVLDAGTAMRWTGSWLTVFTTAQPAWQQAIPVREHLQLIELLGRRRIAGYEVYTPGPRYAGLDLIVTVCAETWALRGEVTAAVGAELGTGRRADGKPAFFAPGSSRFGTPLERSDLEAAIQRAAGVDGVIGIEYRRRGYLPQFVPMPEVVTVAHDEIIGVAGDPSWPDRGSVRVVVEGGK